MRKYSYTILLAITLGIGAVLFVGNKITGLMEKVVAARLASSEETKEEGTDSASVPEKLSDIGEEMVPEAVILEEEQSVSEEAAPAEEPASPDDGEETAAEPSQAEFTLDDALFVGDSRIVGLFEYADMGAAESFADKGMSVYKIMGASITMADGEERTLEEALEARAYGKIYVMLGINELGYHPDKTAEKFESLLEFIEVRQPGVKIIVMANMHVSAEKSASDDVYNNARVDELNGYLKEMTGMGNRFYLDVNELLDDEEGNLNADYTGDGIHLKGQYFSLWADWLREQKF